MNQGFFGFPNNLDNSTIIDIKEFDSSSVYRIPEGAKRINIVLVGSGAGGGAGRRAAASANGGGGGGGSGGAILVHDFLVEELSGPGSALAITIGAGGTGGAGSTATNAANTGGTGGATNVSIIGTRGFLMTAQTGAGGHQGILTTAQGHTELRGRYVY